MVFLSSLLGDSEKTKLNQHGLCVIEREKLLEFRDEDVVERRYASENEEQSENEIIQPRRDNRGSGLVDWRRLVAQSRFGSKCHSISSLEPARPFDGGRFYQHIGPWPAVADLVLPTLG